MMRSLLALAFVAPLAPVAAQPPLDGAMTVVVRPSPEAASPHGSPRAIPILPGQSVVIRDLDWGRSVEGALVELRGGASAAPVRVQVQYETSVSILNDRTRLDVRDWNHVTAPWLAPDKPQLDLRDWKHFTSPWLDLDRDSSGRFRVVMLRSEDRTQFPEIDPMELVQAVRAAGGDAWADLVLDVAGPRDHPATVGLSAIRLRVVCGRPEATFVVEFPVVSSGC